MGDIRAKKFFELPIVFTEVEREGEWRKDAKRTGTLKELLDIWDISDPGEMSEMAQVLRHLQHEFET